ncbi:MAG: hypothetical protein IV092_11680 [Burkholderiaceae bacterium]|nr:hypothetical protein [Burkholderiaceae bacterium]
MLTAYLLVAVVLAACGGGGSDGQPGVTEPALAISAQPADQSVTEGADAAFRVSVTGLAMLQWQVLQAGVWRDVPGETRPEFRLTRVTESDDGTHYRVLLTDLGTTRHELISSTATLRVQSRVVSPAIAVHPTDLTLTAGQSGTLSLTAIGTSLIYEWQNSRDGVQWTRVEANSGPSLALTRVERADSGLMFRALVSNRAGSVSTQAITLTVLAMPQAPSFTSAPVDINVIAGQKASFTAVCVGEPLPTLQWQTSVNGVAWTNVADGHGATLVSKPLALTDDGVLYRAVAVNATGVATSAVARLIVVPAPAAPTIMQQPRSLTVNAPAPASFSVQADGVPSITFQWQVSTDNGLNYFNVNGATESAFSLPATAIGDNGKRYRVVLTNSQGTLTSANASLTVSQAPTITAQPASVITGANDPRVSFQVEAQGWPAPAYQWQSSGDGGQNYDDIAGATSPTYSFVAGHADGGKLFRARISNIAGTIYSHPGHLRKVSWEWISPKFGGDELRAVAWANNKVAVAVGSAGILLRTTDAGQHWTIVREGSINLTNLHAVAFLTPDQAIAVGHKGTVLRSTDGGLTWSPIETGGTAAFSGVAFGSAAVGVAVGGSGVVMRTVDAGRSWRPVAAALNDVWFTAVAMRGTVALAASTKGLWRSTDAGASWTRVNDRWSTALAFADGNTVVVAGEQSMWRSIDAGASWHGVAPPGGQSIFPAITSVHFSGGGRGIAISGGADIYMTIDAGLTWQRSAQSFGLGNGAALTADGTVLAVGQAGLLKRSADFGATWTDISRDPTTIGASLNGLAFSPTSTMLAVGERGTPGVILRSLDSGRTWRDVSNWGPPNYGGLDRLRAVAFADANTAVAVGEWSAMRSVDGGAHWHRLAANGLNHAADIVFLSPLIGIVVAADHIMRSNDGGLTWSSVLASRGEGFSSVSAAGSIVIATGSSEMQRSADGGLTWASLRIGDEPMISTAWFNAATVFAVSNRGSVYRSSDAGLTWSKVFQADANQLYFDSVASINGLGFFVGTSGLIYQSSDHGHTWRLDFGGKPQWWQSVGLTGAGAPVVLGNDGSVLMGSGY